MNNLLSIPAIAFYELTLFESNSPNRKPITYRQSVLAKAFYPFVGFVSGSFLLLIHITVDSVLPEDIADLLVIVGMAFFSNGKHLVGLVLTFQKLLTWKLTKPFWRTLEKVLKMPPLVGITVIATLCLWLFGLSLAPFNFKNQIILVVPIASNWGMTLFTFDNAWKLIRKGEPENNDETISWKESFSALALAFTFTFACFGFLLKLNGILILFIITIFLALIIKATSKLRHEFSESTLGVVHEFSGIAFLCFAYCTL
jgi:hypothetical protein